jgi:hypothetical protein
MKDANNVAINNASYVFKMQLRKHAGETIVKEFTTAGGDFIHGGSNGRMQLYIDVSDIAEIPVGVYEYDIRETDPLGEIRYLFAGKATVVLMVTET